MDPLLQSGAREVGMGSRDLTTHSPVRSEAEDRTRRNRTRARPRVPTQEARGVFLFESED